MKILPLRLWYATLTVLLIVLGVSVGMVESGGMEGVWREMRIEAAMQNMGPNYSYRILWNGTLEVNTGEGWERLKY